MIKLWTLYREREKREIRTKQFRNNDTNIITNQHEHLNDCVYENIQLLATRRIIFNAL